jgi:class 3 adenylate cyclase
VISGRTRTALGGEAIVEDLGELPVKGKERLVQAYVLHALSPRRSEGEERLQDEHREGER